MNDGAQIRYLGQDSGFDGWLTIKNGQEQYFYVLPDGKAFVMGILFDDQGRALTVRQVQRLRGEEGDLLDSLAGEIATPVQEQTAFALKSPAEQLYHDIENSNWVPVGNGGAPVLYSFIDPGCGHCHAFMQDARGAVDGGSLQVRLIPIGFSKENRAKAAFLLAAPNPAERWYAHMTGDDSALPAKTEINEQGIQRNLSIMQTWNLDVTPLILYRSKSGEVKIVRGRPKNIQQLLSDVGTAG